MADKTIGGLTADTSPVGTDIIEFEKDPGGTPVSRKLTFSNVTKALDVMVGDSGSGGTKGLAPAPAAGDSAAGKFLKADGTYAVPPGTGVASTEDVQDIVGAMIVDSSTIDATYNDGAGTESLAVIDDSITNTKLANMAAHTFKGNNTGSAADPLDLTATQLTAELNAVVGDSGAGGTKGLVPAPGAGDGSTKFLKADGTWAIPPGTGVAGTEDVQDIVGAMMTDSTTIDFTYDDGAGTETAIVKDASIDAVKLAAASINDQTGTTYTIQASDNNKVIVCNNASAITVTLPSGLGAGFNCMIVQKGAGQVTISPSSVTMNNRQSHTKTAGQYAAVSLVAYASNVFVLGGDTAA